MKFILFLVFSYNKNRLRYFKTKKDIARLTLALMFVLAGILHFTITEKFILIVPPFIPFPEVMVYLSGFFEILGAIGLLVPQYSRQAAFGLILLLVAVFPANIYMAVENVQLGGILNNPILQWVRIPFQGVLIWWVLWCTEKR